MNGWCDRHLGVAVNGAIHGSVMHTPTSYRKHTESKQPKVLLLVVSEMSSTSIALRVRGTISIKLWCNSADIF